MEYTDHMQIEYAMENFVNRNLEKLNRITSMEIIYDPSLQMLFKKFIQRGHSIKMESTILLERFLLCDKIIHNPRLINNMQYMKRLVKKCTTYEQELMVENLKSKTDGISECLYVLEGFKWRTLIDLICQEDYKNFLNAVRNKSKLIRQILIIIYSDRF